MILFSWLIIVLIQGCSNFNNLFDSSTIVHPKGSDHLQLLFSHNINGETHPCGCRQFPLGGLPQLAGLLHELKKKSPTLWVDTGDTLFPTQLLPPGREKSITYVGEALAESLDELGLKFWLPGDQDFAAGVPLVERLSQNHPFTILLSNLAKKTSIKSRPWIRYQVGENEVYFLGVANPSLYPKDIQPMFTDPFTSVELTLEEIKQDWAERQQNDKRKILILLSHGGEDFDIQMAKKFSQLHWILGAHTQSFTRSPIVENGVQIVQVLSRNHYLGQLKIPFTKDQSPSFDLLEVREELEGNLQPNPMRKKIDEIKAQTIRIQAEEDRAMSGQSFNEHYRLPTYKQCISCHQAQTEFWQTTSHSLAYLTLVNANQYRDLQCIGCHSLGLNDPAGFDSHQDIVRVEAHLNRPPSDAWVKEYWGKVKDSFGSVDSVRELSSKDRKKVSVEWQNLDQAQDVQYQYANVQCLHCHLQPKDHPFHLEDENILPADKASYRRETCLNCHSADQSPHWYTKDERGIPTILDESKLEEFTKQVACPKNE